MIGRKRFRVSSLARGPRVTPGCVSPMLRAVGSHWDCRRHAAACVARVRLSRVCTLHAPDARARTLRADCVPTPLQATPAPTRKEISPVVSATSLHFAGQNFIHRSDDTGTHCLVIVDCLYHLDDKSTLLFCWKCIAILLMDCDGSSSAYLLHVSQFWSWLALFAALT